MIALVCVPSLFWRGLADSFDLTKGSLVWFTGLLLLALGIIDPKIEYFRHTNRLQAGIWIGFVASLLIVFFASPEWQVSLFGQYQRYTGVATLLSCLILAVFIASADRRHVEWLFPTAICVGLAICVSYTWFQKWGIDPFEWQANSFGRLVFGTLGNPNTSSAYVAGSALLLLPIVFDRNQKVLSRAFASFGLMASALTVPVFNSFQSILGLIVGLIAFGLFEGLRQGWVLAMTRLLVVAVALAASLKEWPAGVALGFLVAGITIMVLTPILEQSILTVVTKLRFLFVSMLVGAIALTALVQGSWILNGVKDGMYERSAFYRSGLRAFTENPILGSGLESFGRIFSRNRPVWHAEVLEGSLTSSIHSVPLGMLVSGGVLLASTFVLWIGLISVQAFRNARAGSSCDSAFAASWTAINLMFLVSVEHVALYLLFFSISGLILGRSVALDEGGSIVSRARRARRIRKSRIRGSQIVLGLSCFLLLIPLSIPFRADRHALTGLEILSSGRNTRVAYTELVEASRLASWEGTYFSQRAQVASFIDPALSAQDSILAAEKNSYASSYAVFWALNAANGGRIEEAVEILERALVRDPYAPRFRANALELVSQLGDYVSPGDENLQGRIARLIIRLS